MAVWRWQRHLVGRALPFVSALRGFETWHASAVSIGGRALAFAGSSGWGKSSLAAALILLGGRLIADDVIALETAKEAVHVHPGAGVISLRRETVARFTERELNALGECVGADTHSRRVKVRREEQTLPLAAVYLLEPGRSGNAVRHIEMAAPEPARLLASTFNAALTGRARLSLQLEVSAAVSRHVKVVRLVIPPDADFRKLAERVIADLGTIGGETS